MMTKEAYFLYFVPFPCLFPSPSQLTLLNTTKVGGQSPPEKVVNLPDLMSSGGDFPGSDMKLLTSSLA